MLPVSSYAPAKSDAPAPGGYGFIAVVFGILAIAAYIVLALPTDLITLGLSDILGPLWPLALGPELLFSPLGFIPAIAGVLVGWRGMRIASRQPGQNGASRSKAQLAKTGLILGWIAIALNLLNLVLVILSFMNITAPLI